MSTSSAQKKRKSMSSVGTPSLSSATSPMKDSGSALSVEEQRKRARLWMEEQKLASASANGNGATATATTPRSKTPTKAKTPTSAKAPAAPVSTDAPLSAAEQRQRAKEWYEMQQKAQQQQDDGAVSSTPAPVVGTKRKDTPIDVPSTIAAAGRASRRKSVGPGVTPDITRRGAIKEEDEEEEENGTVELKTAAKKAAVRSSGRKSLKPVVEEREEDEEEEEATVPINLRPSLGRTAAIVPPSENSVFKSGGRRSSLDSALSRNTPGTNGRPKTPSLLDSPPRTVASNGNTAERRRLSLDSSASKIPAPFTSPDLFASMLEASTTRGKGRSSRASMPAVSPPEASRRTSLQEPPSRLSMYDENIYMHPASLRSPARAGTPILADSPGDETVTLNLPDVESPPRRKISTSRTASPARASITTATPSTASVEEQRRRAAEWAMNNNIRVSQDEQSSSGRKSIGRTQAVRVVEASPVVIATAAPTYDEYVDKIASRENGSVHVQSRAQQHHDEPLPSYAFATALRVAIVAVAAGLWYYQYGQNPVGLAALVSDARTSVVSAYQSGYNLTLKSVRTGIFFALIAALVAPIVFAGVKLVLWFLDTSRR